MPGCGRPLGPSNLLTLEEVARELRVGEDKAKALLTAVKPIHQGRARLYVWSDVLALARPAAPTPRPRRPRSSEFTRKKDDWC